MRFMRLYVCLFTVIMAAQAVAQSENTNTASSVFGDAIAKILEMIEPPEGASAKTFQTTVRIIKAEGIPSLFKERTAKLAFQAPDRVTLSAEVDNNQYAIGRDGQEVWILASKKKFGVVGMPGLPRFASAPEKIDQTRLGAIKLPVQKEQLALAPLLFQYTEQPDEVIGGEKCRVFKATPQPQAAQLLKIPKGSLSVAVRNKDSLPARLGWSDGKKVDVVIQFDDPRLGEAWKADKWKIPAGADTTVQKTALTHVTRFIDAALATVNNKIPTLPMETNGIRKVVATAGEGRLETMDGTRILFLKGTPEEMGQQHGTLMKRQIRQVVQRILYGIGVGSSFEKGRWFFSEIEEAQAKLKIDPRYLREMDAIAQYAGLEKEEIRLANFFPELFHCSGFAVYGKATQDGRMYHGRILDYLKGVGLEQSAVVIVFQPDQGNAWVNLSYAGFVGSVTAMNAKHVAIGEMGGRGEGKWDGKPMAQLMREVMEKSSTIDQAVEIMRKGPRTCEYYYVISDGNSKKAVGISATPDTFETIWAGQSHARLPHAVEDAVLLSAGDRYETLVKRVKEGYGGFNAKTARDLMTRPVCMKSNIQSVLFAPETLDFWVANADSANVASHTRFTAYNLGDLLKGPPQKAE